MRLYHGNLSLVTRPEIRPGSHTTDFGRGFYTTTSLEQAEEFVQHRLQDGGPELGYVNVYDLDTEALSGLDVLHFEKADVEWVRFVKSNRVDKCFVHGHDLVSGPVADDRVYGAITLFVQDVYDEAQLIKELKSYRLRDQWLFHTPKALARLRFVEYLEVLRHA